MSLSIPLPRTTPNIIGLLAETAPPLLDAELPSGYCVPATRIGIDVFDHFGIHARACPTRVAAGDRLGLKLFDAVSRGGFPLVKRVPRLIQCGFTTPFDVTVHPGEYDRHLVIAVEGGTLVDLGTRFFSLPGAVIPRTVVRVVDDAFWRAKTPLSVKGSSGTIRYYADPSDQSHLRFRSWQGLEVTRRLTQEIIAAMTPRLDPLSTALQAVHRRSA